jgi:S1-C subfamily serine protease
MASGLRFAHAVRESGRSILAAMLLSIALVSPAPSQASHLPPDVAGAVVGAMVRVVAEVPRDARTVDTLGPVREGNGVVIDSSGLILTIGYLVVEATKVEITDSHNKTIPAAVIAYDHETGFGLLRAAVPLETKPLRFGKSQTIKAGDDALVVSHAGEMLALPVKVVARRTFTGYWEYLLENALFTAPAHPAYGGAALVNANGELVGIGSLLIGDPVPGQTVGLGNMFVPIDELPPILADLLDSGRAQRPPRPWLGIYTNEYMGSVVVTSATPGGPAAKAGLSRGDVLVAVGGEKVKSMEDFLRKLWALGDAGVDVQLDIGSITQADAPVRRIVIKSQSRYDFLKLGGGY